MTEAYFFVESEKVSQALELLGIEDFRGQRVPVKLHMGHPGNPYYVSPSFVRLVIEKLKAVGADPFPFDTTVAYAGPRQTRQGYERVARRHGFKTEILGCEPVIGDEGFKVMESGRSFEVAREIYEASHLLVISHVKGHIGAGFGGAIKNLGMGGVTSETKRRIHHMSIPKHLVGECNMCASCAEACPYEAITLDDAWQYDGAKCDGCGKCVAACPSGALEYETMELQQGLALSARACITNKRAIYVNVLLNITRSCDCDPNPGPIICRDIGYLASDEVAAADKASLELVHRVEPGLFEEVNRVDPFKQISYAEQLGLRSSYALKRI